MGLCGHIAHCKFKAPAETTDGSPTTKGGVKSSSKESISAALKQVEKKLEEKTEKAFSEMVKQIGTLTESTLAGLETARRALQSKPNTHAPDFDHGHQGLLLQEVLESSRFARETARSAQASSSSTNSQVCDMFMAVVQTRDERLTAKLLESAAQMKDVTCLETLMSHAQPMVTSTCNQGARPTSKKISNFDVTETVDFLQKNGFVSYADHFQKEGYNGQMLLAAEQSDVEQMPETNQLKRKTFLRFLASLKQPR
jgi:hypothetical protein